MPGFLERLHTLWAALRLRLRGGAPEPMLLALSVQALTSDGAFSMVLPPKS